MPTNEVHSRIFVRLNGEFVAPISYVYKSAIVKLFATSLIHPFK